MNHRLPSHQRRSCKQRCPCSPQVHRYHKCRCRSHRKRNHLHKRPTHLPCCRRSRTRHRQCRHRHIRRTHPIASKSRRRPSHQRCSYTQNRRYNPPLQIHHTCRRRPHRSSNCRRSRNRQQGRCRRNHMRHRQCRHRHIRRTSSNCKQGVVVRRISVVVTRRIVGTAQHGVSATAAFAIFKECAGAIKRECLPISVEPSPFSKIWKFISPENVPGVVNCMTKTAPSSLGKPLGEPFKTYHASRLGIDYDVIAVNGRTRLE